MSYCSSLASVKLPTTLRVIDQYAFSCCPSLSSVNLPAGLTTIGDGAFLNGISLSSIRIPETVTTIGVNAFLGCTILAQRSKAAGKSIELHLRDEWSRIRLRYTVLACLRRQRVALLSTGSYVAVDDPATPSPFPPLLDVSSSAPSLLLLSASSSSSSLIAAASSAVASASRAFVEAQESGAPCGPAWEKASRAMLKAGEAGTAVEVAGAATAEEREAKRARTVSPDSNSYFAGRLASTPMTMDQADVVWRRILAFI